MHGKAHGKRHGKRRQCTSTTSTMNGGRTGVEKVETGVKKVEIEIGNGNWCGGCRYACDGCDASGADEWKEHRPRCRFPRDRGGQ